MYSLCFISDGNFITIILAKPDVNDHSNAAGVVRIITFVVYHQSIGLSLEFKNLRVYFYSCNGIFKGNEDQKVKEQRYKGFKIGIQWHADVLRYM